MQQLESCLGRSKCGVGVLVAQHYVYYWIMRSPFGVWNASMVLICLCSNKAIIAHHLTHNVPILLLHIALIVLECRTTPRKGDLFGFTIAQEEIVHEFGSVIRIQAQEWERESENVPVGVRQAQPPHSW